MEKIVLSYKSYKVIAYHKQGKTNEKIVFMHGGAMDNSMMSWKEVIELMGNDYDIYAIDMLGFGESDKPDITYSIPMFVELLYDVLGQLKIEKTNLVGLSMGGGISIAFSLKYPQMVNKLTIVDSMGLYSRMPHFHSFCRWYVNSKFNDKSNEWFGKSKKLVKWGIASVMFGDKNRISDELVDDLYNLVHEPHSGRAWESFQRYEIGKKKLTTDLTSHLSELTMPVLIVNGEKDSAVPVKFAAEASKVIKNSELHIMKGCKHWSQKEKPEKFVQVLKKFLLV
ncbi:MULTISPECIES: alpha/beta fold hydrolase [Clostridium]|uniref:alpha/beta fold hydrolase n=1 Tax=Clostridium TaxID=1485 RepID=UPI000825D3EB|nr:MULTISPECIES: alpha/beta hydrolase [Clostridium]PJI08209.1 alpha/beta hydrolase [Clostridium sp. CT7]